MNEDGYPTVERNPDTVAYSGREVRDGQAQPPQLAAQGLSQGQAEIAAPSPPKARQVVIEPKDHGFIVTVGCQTFAIEKVSTLIRNLEKYLERPAETEKKWVSGKLEL